MISSKFSLQEKKKNVNTDNKSVVGKTQTAGTGQEERRGEEEREKKKKQTTITASSRLILHIVGIPELGVGGEQH